MVYLLNNLDSMKLIIALALVAAVAAHPDPVVLPNAVEPAFEAQDAQPVNLPAAKLPALEDDAVPAFEPVESLFPKVMEIAELAEALEIPAEPVHFVDNAEEIPEAEFADIPAEPVNFVDNVDAAFSVDDIQADPVRVVDNAFEPFEYVYVPQDYQQEVQPIALPKAALPAVEDGPIFEAIDISPVFVPAEVMEELQRNGFFEIPAESVKVADGPEDDFDPTRVRVVEVAENTPVEFPEAVQVAPGELESVRVIAPEIQEDGLKVKVVDTPDFSVPQPKVFDNPLLR